MTETPSANVAHLGRLLDGIARQPTTAGLWSLHGTLLACTQDHPDAPLVNELAREFYLYLSEVQSKLSARQYNELASRLDVGSVGTLALQDVLFERQDVWKNLLLGGIGEGLMVLASRQYIKAWEQELESVHRRAAWFLYGVLWQLSLRFQADLSSTERQALIEKTLAPTLEGDTPVESKILLILRLYQTLLILLAAPMCADLAD